MAFCINCGAKLPDTAKFCNECGFKVTTTQSKQENSYVPNFNSGENTYVESDASIPSSAAINQKHPSNITDISVSDKEPDIDEIDVEETHSNASLPDTDEEEEEYYEEDEEFDSDGNYDDDTSEEELYDDDEFSGSNQTTSSDARPLHKVDLSELSTARPEETTQQTQQILHSETPDTPNIKENHVTINTINPLEDPYWDDVLPEIDNEIYQIPKDIILKILVIILLIFLIIAWLIYWMS